MRRRYAAPRPRSAAVAVAVAVVAVGIALALRGCGGSRPDPQAQVRDTLNRFGQAVAHHDYALVCRELLAADLTDHLAEIGVPCVRGLAKGFGPAVKPMLSVKTIVVRGTAASAIVHTSAANQAPSDDSVKLVKAGGGWRITSLGLAPGPPKGH